MPLDIEQHDQLIAYLREIGRIASDETPTCQTLAGGVSNRTVLLTRPSGEAWVLKQALAKLRVKVDWFSNPSRIHREALGLTWLAKLAPSGTITPLVFEDLDHHLLAMDAVPQPHENWKTMLLSGRVSMDHVRQFADLLASIHRRSAESTEPLRATFDDRSFFESLRIEPYYAYAAEQAPGAREFLHQLIAETRERRLALVHGDYSPKNILVRDGRLILLDHEVIHWGDPAFDIGFALTHLLSKSNHLRDPRFIAVARTFCDVYRAAALLDNDFAARHTLACMLARVAGRSPLEYLDETARQRQQDWVIAMIARADARCPNFLTALESFMPTIEHVSAMEILDSRGRPTVSAALRLRGGATAAVSVPSGASTGAAEAHELRDGDPKRYGGLGVRNAVSNVTGEIATNVIGKSFEHQSDLDRALIALDGTPNKSRLGANAILAVSIAFARAHAIARNVPLYQHFADMIGQPLKTLPRLTINLFSGGKHAGGQVPIQDVLLVPIAATIEHGLAVVYDVYHAARKLALRKYNTRALKADEGGLAPPFPSVEAMFDDAVEAIRDAGYEPGRDVALAIDVASSHFYADGIYQLAERKLAWNAMTALLHEWLRRWPIVSIEDGLAENDWSSWPALKHAIGGRALVLGDDFLCTNPARIRRAVETNAANALLLKVNQIGTLTEAAEALKLARDAVWKVTISARSGETEDNWLADLAVGWAGDQIKVGSIAQSERLAKYNRLLAIEAETKLPVVAWPK